MARPQKLPADLRLAAAELPPNDKRRRTDSLAAAWPTRRTQNYGVNVRLTLKFPSFVVPEK